jgi:hypothetical protein
LTGLGLDEHHARHPFGRRVALAPLHVEAPMLAALPTELDRGETLDRDVARRRQLSRYN